MIVVKLAKLAQFQQNGGPNQLGPTNVKTCVNNLEMLPSSDQLGLYFTQGMHIVHHRRGGTKLEITA